MAISRSRRAYDAEQNAGMDLTAVERCYDAIPRPLSTTEEVGPFTLFVAEAGQGWPLYARPRLGEEVFTADDVRRVLHRERELGVPLAIEWIDEVTPALAPAVRAAVPDAALEACPLLVAEAVTIQPPQRHRCRVLGPDDPDLPLALGVVHAGFEGTDEAEAADVRQRPAMIAAGNLIVVAAYDDQGRMVSGGSAAPRGAAAELMGIATLVSSRGRGFGGDVTRALAVAAREAGVETVFLGAASDAASSVYRSTGFERVATAMILDAGS